MMSIFLFLFFHRLGLGYAALNAFAFAEGQEASEFDQPQGKIIFRAIKLLVMTITLANIAPTLPIALLLASIYGAHTFYLTTFDENANRVSYNQYLKRFWRGFSLLTIAALASHLLVSLAPFALGLVAASALPFLVKELKLIIPPTNLIGGFLHHFDENFAKWAPLASLLVAPVTFFGRLANYFLVAITVYRPIIDHISYISNRLFSLSFMRAMSAFYRFEYMPAIVKNSYNATFGRLHDELEAFFDYYNRAELTVAEMKHFIDSGNVAQLRPAVENLYKGRPRKAFIAQANIAGSALQATAQFREVLQRTLEAQEDFNALVDQMAAKSSCFRNMLVALESENDKNALRLFVESYLVDRPAYEAALSQQPQRILDVGAIIIDNIETVFSIIANPRTQLGAEQVLGTSDKIPSGLSALFSKFFLGMNEAASARLDEENHQRVQELRNRNYRLLASIFDTALRCQNALQGLITEETQQDFVHEPLIASWGEYVNHQIAGAQARLVTGFTREVAYNPNGQWDENIQRQFGVPVNPAYVAIINAFFSFDPYNVDHQRIVASRFLPQQTEDETFRAFSSVIINRHIDLYELNPFYIGTSFFHHLLYPTLFSAYSVEDLIARTQEVYAHTIFDAQESGTELPAWTVRWQNHWVRYLNTAYPVARIQELPEQCDSENLYNAYIDQQNNDQRALGLYDPSLTDEARADMAAQENIGLVGTAKMQALIESLGEENLPEGFAGWNDYTKRCYLHMDAPMVTGADLYSGFVDQAAQGNLDAELNARRRIVSREFALVVLFSEGLVTPAHALHQKIGELGILARFMNPEEKLKRLGYTN